MSVCVWCAAAAWLSCPALPSMCLDEWGKTMGKLRCCQAFEKGKCQSPETGETLGKSLGKCLSVSQTAKQRSKQSIKHLASEAKPVRPCRNSDMAGRQNKNSSKFGLFLRSRANSTISPGQGHSLQGTVDGLSLIATLAASMIAEF